MSAELLEQTPDLAALSMDELAALSGQDDETDAAIIAECERRDRADAAAKRRAKRRLDPLTAEWREAAYAQYLAAEAACNGELVRDPLDAPFEDAFALWSGTDQFVARWASEELRNFWREHPRITVTAYRRMVREQKGSHVAELEAEAYEYVPADVAEAAPVSGFLTYADAERAPLETEWTWKGRLPRGKVILVAGWRQSAKGLLACDIAARVTTGAPFPGESETHEPGDVVTITAEDDACEDMAWRLRAAGADLARVHDMTYLPDGSPFELSASAADPGNTADLLAYIRRLRAAGRNPRLVILDPLNALVMSGSIKTDQGARRVIGRLQFVAARTGVTIILIHHLVTAASGKAGKVAGSQGLEDAPRWIYRIETDPDAPELKVFHLHKCNVAVAEDLRYRIISEGHDSRIEWVDRQQIQSEERAWRERDRPALRVVEAWREPTAAVQSAPHPGRAAVLEWLNAGGGQVADCVKTTGLDEETCRWLLTELTASGMARGKRRLASPFRKSG